MDILQAVLPVFLVIAIGAAARRFRFLGDPFIDTANMLVYYLLLPALLFYKIGTSNFREAFNAPLVIGGYAATVATFLLAVFLSRALGISPAERGSFVQGAFRANLAYVGLPIVLSAAGDIGLRKGGILLGFMVPLLNSLAVVALILPHGDGKGRARENARRIGLQLVTNPLILSSFLGIVWSMLKFPLPGLVDNTLEILSSATLPLSLLCLGGSFSFERARSGFRVASLAAGMKTLLLTAIAVALYRWMGLSGQDLRVGVIMMGCPTAVITYVMASQLNGDTDLAGTIIVLSTATSAVTISGWLHVLHVAGW
ncbi:MAG TPA: AEC family transporter [Candidatus Deferrimicrobiaceae bacterium]|nr:AEC family transporter [Candidatus Deferrimicrobiaceae bacterium]